MATPTSATDLQRQMRETRQNIGFHSDAMVHDVQEARARLERRLDWRNYVSNHPWITLAAAAAAGYLLVPRRHRCAGVDSKALHRTVDQAVRDSHRAAASPAPGIVGGLVSTAVGLLVREGVNLASGLVRDFISQQSNRGQPSDRGQQSNRASGVKP